MAFASGAELYGTHISLQQEMYLNLVRLEPSMILYRGRQPDTKLYRSGVLQFLKDMCVSYRDRVETDTPFALSAETLHLAVYLYDAYNDHYRFVPEQRFLVAAVALSLASKVEEKDSRQPQLECMFDRARQLVTHPGCKQQYVNLLVPSVAQYLPFLLWLGTGLHRDEVCVHYGVLHAKLETAAHNINLLYDDNQVQDSTDHFHLPGAREPPSVVACACLFVARRMLHVPTVWPKSVHKRTLIGASRLSTCAYNFQRSFLAHFNIESVFDQESAQAQRRASPELLSPPILIDLVHDDHDHNAPPPPRRKVMPPRQKDGCWTSLQNRNGTEIVLSAPFQKPATQRTSVFDRLSNWQGPEAFTSRAQMDRIRNRLYPQYQPQRPTPMRISTDALLDMVPPPPKLERELPVSYPLDHSLMQPPPPLTLSEPPPPPPNQVSYVSSSSGDGSAYGAGSQGSSDYHADNEYEEHDTKVVAMSPSAWLVPTGLDEESGVWQTQKPTNHSLQLIGHNHNMSNMHYAVNTQVHDSSEQTRDSQSGAQRFSLSSCESVDVKCESGSLQSPPDFTQEDDGQPAGSSKNSSGLSLTSVGDQADCPCDPTPSLALAHGLGQGARAAAGAELMPVERDYMKGIKRKLGGSTSTPKRSFVFRDLFRK